MKGSVSEDAVRLGIGRIDEKSGLDGISGQILGSIAPALSLPWIAALAAMRCALRGI